MLRLPVKASSFGSSNRPSNLVIENINDWFVFGYVPPFRDPSIPTLSPSTNQIGIGRKDSVRRLIKAMKRAANRGSLPRETQLVAGLCTNSPAKRARPPVMNAKDRSHMNTSQRAGGGGKLPPPLFKRGGL